MPELDEAVRRLAVQQGADLYGVAPAETYTDYRAQLQRRMAETGATHIDFMIHPEDHGHFERISDPRHTLPSAQAVIVAGIYAYDTRAVEPPAARPLRGKIARTYAYYPAARRIGAALAQFLQDQGYRAVHGQDVPLKYVAARLGLGCYGKNGVLLTPRFGSYVAWRSVITDAPLVPSQSEVPALCQDCDRCLQACPTGALYAPGKVNPRRCINPITRRSEPIPPELRRRLHNWVRGCDICQEVCPVNRRLTPRTPDPRAQYEPQNHETHRGLGGLERFPDLIGLLGPDRPDNLRRHAAIALANAAVDNSHALAALHTRLDSCSADLRHYFQWAIDTLSRDKRPRPD
jgi:epoxyqueuosine reductase